MGWGGGGFSTILKLSIRSRLITAIHLAFKSHMDATWRSQRHAMLLLTDETLLASRKPPKPIMIFAAQHFGCCISSWNVHWLCWTSCGFPLLTPLCSWHWWCGGHHVMQSCGNHLLASCISFSNVHLCAQHTSWSNRIYIKILYFSSSDTEARCHI